MTMNPLHGSCLADRTIQALDGINARHQINRIKPYPNQSNLTVIFLSSRPAGRVFFYPVNRHVLAAVARLDVYR